jgi:hypothetical protein
MITVPEAEARLTAIADNLETIFNELADARDATPPGAGRAKLRNLARGAERAMKIFGRKGL